MPAEQPDEERPPDEPAPIPQRRAPREPKHFLAEVPKARQTAARGRGRIKVRVKDAASGRTARRGSIMGRQRTMSVHGDLARVPTRGTVLSSSPLVHIFGRSGLRVWLLGMLAAVESFSGELSRPLPIFSSSIPTTPPAVRAARLVWLQPFVTTADSPCCRRRRCRSSCHSPRRCHT